MDSFQHIMSQSLCAKEPLQQESVKRCDARKQGSRWKRRWENDRLLSNPYAQAPLPIDWEVHPTYPVRTVPYHLAYLWDTEYGPWNATWRAKDSDSLKFKRTPAEEAASKVSKELRGKLKRARNAKGLLQEMEERARCFIELWKEREQYKEREALVDPDSSDDDIVFIGRGGQMSDMYSPRSSAFLLPRDVMLFDGPQDEKGTSFGRWLAHSIASYYGLRSWSRTDDYLARRKTFASIDKTPGGQLWRPLWEIV